jgi:hypothetical protein
MKTFKEKICFFLISILCAFPIVSYGAEQTFTPLIRNLPWLNYGGSMGTEDYVAALYTISISLAALLVVLRLILAGVKYMFSELITSKEDAKKEIWSSLLGLLIILSAVTILTTINPNLKNLDALSTLRYSNSIVNPDNSKAEGTTCGKGTIACLFKGNPVPKGQEGYAGDSSGETHMESDHGN